MGVYRATVDLRFGAGTGRGTNTWCFRTIGGLTETDDIEDLGEKLATFYGAVAFTMPVNSTFSWDGTVQELGVPEPAFREPVTGFTVAGGQTASTYGPAAAMACITWRTSLASRSGRGRTFLGPLALSAYQGDGTLVESYLSGIRNAAQALVDASTNDTDSQAIAVWSEADGVARDIIGSTVRDTVAILRSRR